MLWPVKEEIKMAAAAARWSLALCCACAVGPALARTVTIRNDQPRLDVDGNYIDAHDGITPAGHRRHQ